MKSPGNNKYLVIGVCRHEGEPSLIAGLGQALDAKMILQVLEGLLIGWSMWGLMISRGLKRLSTLCDLRIFFCYYSVVQLTSNDSATLEM